MLNDFKLVGVDNFNLLEFQCHCVCQQVKIGHDLVMELQQLRQKIGVPITVVSAYRCPTQNAKVGGAKESYHMQGRAVDITASIPLNVIMKAAKEIGFRGIGKYPDENFVHLDNREQECYWVKYRNKDYKYMNFEETLGA